jgi:antitoxin component YwqK of YwqJK toxin-antitoxin module
MKNKDIKPLNENGERHGYWEDYYSNGQLAYKGNYVNSNRHGYWEVYYNNGQLVNKTYYI